MVAASYLGGGNMYFKDIPACLVTVYILRQIQQPSGETTWQLSVDT
jgi:hypothetical protein